MGENDGLGLAEQDLERVEVAAPGPGGDVVQGEKVVKAEQGLGLGRGHPSEEVEAGANGIVAGLPLGIQVPDGHERVAAGLLGVPQGRSAVATVTWRRVGVQVNILLFI